MRSLSYLLIGIFFGITMFKSEASSWFRIYEMFKFDAFHMYGIIGTAVIFGVIIVATIKRFRIKSFYGDPIEFTPKDKSLARYIIGGFIFGLGWGLSGACPGPMFTLTGAGYLPVLIVILGAVAGTWIYGLIKDRLPH
ncbi:MAG: YeeE/YedE family protein [Bacteroidetes bacterium]|nr:MAG: YeeE/YedE family protein [Bacteroidota bacterium]UCE68350.1 MAG: YeeE/YedE family protein [Flavobacteriaceae bacterium]